MQSSLLQTAGFILFMLSMYCTASMLPCGRYYYAPEGGYVGNPWVKFSYQYCYVYMAWILHHLDIIEHSGFQFSQVFVRRCSKLYSRAMKKARLWDVQSNNFNTTLELNSKITYTSKYYKASIIRAPKTLNR